MAFLPMLFGNCFSVITFHQLPSAIEVFNTAIPQSRRKAASNVPAGPGNSSLLSAPVRRAENQPLNDIGISRTKGYGT
jgi:hypothetical protein